MQHTVDSSQQAQQSTSQHLLAQLLLVYQWTAALCRIWPSSIPDAAPLRKLLCSALAGAAQLLAQLPHMQADGQASSGNDASPAAAERTEQSPQMTGRITASLPEVAAVVLEPLGLILLQQQRAERQGSQPPTMSAPAKGLCGVLGADTAHLLQALLSACLQQLMLQAQFKRGLQNHPEWVKCDSSLVEEMSADSSMRQTIAQQLLDEVSMQTDAAFSTASRSMWQ